jgi:hypothetical protein
VPLALVVLVKPAPVKPALLLSIVPSTLQKPVVLSCRVRVVLLPELEELLLEEELELELLELEELVELLLDELVEPVVELELEEELDEVLEELLLEVEPVELLELEELELLELELEELLAVPPLPVQVGAVKLPSCVPWKPKTLLAVWPGAGSCQLCWLVNCQVVPGVLSDGVRVTFHWPTGVMVSGKVRVIVQLLSAVVPVLVTLMST